jgi:large subunit ribosomal protein L30
MKNTKKIKVKLVHSGISTPPKHRATRKGGGLTRLNQERELVDTPQVRGMVAKIPHLVQIVGEGV